MSPTVQLSIFDTPNARSKSSAETRMHKGRSLITVLDEYIAVDIETSGLDPSWDSIIELAAVHMKNGAVVDTFASLCNTCEVDPEITELTGITNAMLSEAPGIDAVLPKFAAFAGDLPLVGHNIVQFDSNFIYDAYAETIGNPLTNDMVDTLRLCRLTFAHLPNRKLSTVLEYLEIQNEQAHRALSDAICTAQLYEKLKPYIVGGNALPESRAFGGYDYDLILQSMRRMVGDDGSTVTLTVNKDFATIYIFKKKAFSIRLDVREPYIESDKSVCFDFVPRISKARQLKNTARFTVASSPDDVPAIEEMVLAMYNYFADRQTNYSMMACCNDFVRCSDALECLHKYEEDYAGCWYRKNLEKGRIFYGKNRNV